MNAEKNDEKVVEAAHLDPQSYPKLRSKLDIIIAGRNQKPSMKVVRVDNRDYPFFLSLVADKNGKEQEFCDYFYSKDYENSILDVIVEPTKGTKSSIATGKPYKCSPATTSCARSKLLKMTLSVISASIRLLGTLYCAIMRRNCGIKRESFKCKRE